MSLDQREITLGEDQMVIQQMPTTRALEVACQIAKMLAGAGDGVGEFGKSVLDLNLNIGRIVQGLADRLDQNGTPAFVKGIVRDSLVLPQWSDELYETRFSGCLDELFQLVAAILDLNYARSLETLKKKATPFMERLSPKGEEKESIPSSSGRSGGAG